MPDNGLPVKLKDFLELISGNDSKPLRHRADKLHGIIGGGISVLPPDTRHVGYDVIPVMIVDVHLHQYRDRIGRSRYPEISEQTFRYPKN